MLAGAGVAATPKGDGLGAAPKGDADESPPDPNGVLDGAGFPNGEEEPMVVGPGAGPNGDAGGFPNAEPVFMAPPEENGEADPSVFDCPLLWNGDGAPLPVEAPPKENGD